MLGGSGATSSGVTSLTTFLSNVVVASLFSKSNGLSVASLFNWSSISEWRRCHTKTFMRSRQKHFCTTVTSSIVNCSRGSQDVYLILWFQMSHWILSENTVCPVSAQTLAQACPCKLCAHIRTIKAFYFYMKFLFFCRRAVGAENTSYCLKV